LTPTAKSSVLAEDPALNYADAAEIDLFLEYLRIP